MTADDTIAAPVYSPVVVDMNELVFSPTVEAHSFVVKNTSESTIFFKVELTVVECCRVKPNKVILAPKQSQTINVTWVKHSTTGKPLQLLVGTIIVPESDEPGDMDSILSRHADAKEGFMARRRKLILKKPCETMLYSHIMKIRWNEPLKEDSSNDGTCTKENTSNEETAKEDAAEENTSTSTVTERKKKSPLPIFFQNVFKLGSKK
ncbi:hypothetical protein HDU79_005220 [Rhizoclosmatium sp. JEL0117]|nr:hypothetical protein HDU79_005220 [Rhizoclosmatium sp. JEL0117]